MIYETNKEVKLDFTKIKNFCSTNDIIKRMKRKITDWEKKIAKYIYDEIQKSENTKF